MTSRTTIGWQTTLADLSLILFLITAAAVSHRVPRVRHAVVPPSAAPAAASPAPGAPGAPGLAVWIAAPGAPPLGEWLAAQDRDPRQRLTVIACYRPADGPATAVAQAAQLLNDAGTAGRGGRLVVEPGEGPLRALLAFEGDDRVTELPFATR